MDGVEEWNKRRSVETFVVNLTDSDIGGLDLSRVNMSYGQFAGSNLENARLGSADLENSDLGLANLNEASLGRANRLIERVQATYADYPELAESGDPENTRFISDGYPLTGDQITKEVEEIANEAEVFTPRAAELIEAEKAHRAPPKADAEKTRQARMSGIVAEMLSGIKRAIAKFPNLADPWLKPWSG